MTKSVQFRLMVLFLFLSGAAFAAGGAGAGTIFQTAWTTLSNILGDTYLGYIIAAFMLIKAIAVYMTEGGNWTKILMFILAAGFTASITTLAQSLSGAAF